MKHSFYDRRGVAVNRRGAHTTRRQTDPSGVRSGYTFKLTVSASPQSGYTATAEPLDHSYSAPSYFVDETGVIRFEAGGPATASSAPIQ